MKTSRTNRGDRKGRMERKDLVYRLCFKMTEEAFVKDGYWPALDKARCGNWGRNKKLEKKHTYTELERLVYLCSICSINDS